MKNSKHKIGSVALNSKCLALKFLFVSYRIPQITSKKYLNVHFENYKYFWYKIIVKYPNLK